MAPTLWGSGILLILGIVIVIAVTTVIVLFVWQNKAELFMLLSKIIAFCGIIFGAILILSVFTNNYNVYNDSIKLQSIIGTIIACISFIGLIVIEVMEMFHKK
ncbi:MAG: hypothetical protein LBQ54_14805 [Planctomycetaceae bacterium]|jgi:hypothetical protein|nr:hypothetical protein [Planctomycetaceae bacterium]